MNGRIELKDGFCVSCGRESGSVYRSCPFCDEQVWHPLWRKFIFLYVTVALPLLLSALFIVYRTAFVSAMETFAAANWKIQVAAVIPATALLLPFDNRKLVFASVRNHVLWALNALAASFILLMCAFVFAVGARVYADSFGLSLFISAALSGLAVPLVMNCNWWRVFAAVLCAALLSCI